MNKKICILMATVLSVLYLNSCSLFHTHLYKDVKVVEPTCTEKGYTLHTCKCGDSYKSDETNKLGHDAEWVVTDRPSCTKSGRKEYRCKRCNPLFMTYISGFYQSSYPNGWSPTVELLQIRETNIGLK